MGWLNEIDALVTIRQRMIVLQKSAAGMYSLSTPAQS